MNSPAPLFRIRSIPGFRCRIAQVVQNKRGSDPGQDTKMARKNRIWYPGAIYHVMNRGNRKADIFKDPADYVNFLDIIGDIREKYPFTIHSICLMTNHFHIAIETCETKLSQIMQKILSIYAEEFNHRHGYHGHVFEGRYFAPLIENERYFLEVSRYIHLNPVKAQLVRDPAFYEYSSYGLFIPTEPDHEMGKLEKLIAELVDTERVLNAFEGNSKERYREFVERKMAHAEEEQLIRREIKEDEKGMPLWGQTPLRDC